MEQFYALKIISQCIVYMTREYLKKNGDSELFKLLILRKFTVQFDLDYMYIEFSFKITYSQV